MPQFLTSEAYGETRDPRKTLTATENIPDNVTLSELMSMKPDDSFISVPVPRVTPDRVMYDPIYFNANVTFLPGETYLVHPLVAEQLYRAIRNHAESINKQKMGRTIEHDNLLGELKRQEEAERVMHDQFAAAGISV